VQHPGQQWHRQAKAHLGQVRGQLVGVLGEVRGYLCLNAAQLFIQHFGVAKKLRIGMVDFWELKRGRRQQAQRRQPLAPVPGG